MEKVTPSEYRNIESLMKSNAAIDGNYIPLVSGSEGTGMSDIFFGNDSYYNVADDGLSCWELFAGSGIDAKPILTVSGKREPENDVSDKKRFLKDMGYEIVEDSGDSNLTCYAANFTQEETPRRTNTVCLDNTTKELSSVGTSSGAAEFYIDDKNELCLRMKVASLAGDQEKRMGCKEMNELSPSSIHDAILDFCSSETCTKNSYVGGTGYTTKVVFAAEGRGYPPQQVGGSSDSAVIRSESTSGLRAVKYLSGTDYDAESIKVTRPEQRVLYQEYLQSYYGVEINCEDDALGNGNGTVHWFDSASGTMKDCQIVKMGDNSGDPVNGIVNGNFSYHSIANLDALIAELNSDEMKEYDETEMDEIGKVAGDVRADKDEDVLEDCRNSGAGNTLGWILCPILEIMGDAAIGMYDEVVEPELRVKSQLFSNEEQAGSVPYAGWQQFRDIANVAFAVLLLVVIFSQLTGVGIDNYGIKRILPKLVIAIVLINLSYLVCMLLVDVSNIVGNGIQNLFDGLGNGLTEKTALMIPDASPKDGGGGGIATTGGNIVAVGLLAGLAFMTGPIWLNPITLFSLLFAALGVVISLVFLFLLLSVRQAAIVVLVVVSPVVVVCNILPNTKSLFDRWVKLFKTLLMVYPIAGLLVGGGNYVSKLLLAVSPDSFPMALTAMVMGIAPIFFLPGVLKDAMAMLGKVGATLNGLGDRAKGLSNRAGGSVLRSEPVKDIDRNFQLGRARKTVERLNKKGSLTGFQARKLAANASMLEKDEKEEKAARVFAFREKYKNGRYEDLEQATKNALESGNEHDSYGLLGAMNYIYGAKQTAKFIGGFYGEQGHDLVGEGSNNRRKSIKGASEVVNANSGILAELKENHKDIADMVASAGMDGDKPQSLANYTRKMANMEEKKWLTQDPEAIERASKAKVLRPETAASVLNKAQNPSSSYSGALKGNTRDAMVSFLKDQHYSQDADGMWVPPTSQPTSDGNNANGVGTLNGGRAFDAGSGFNQRQANDWDRQQQSEDQWGG
ncbi:hypothetical protein IKF04_00665 [Candidatus Saccharibacteria bacterium]|nr:hypothetical protein [Candidatus Saccharibacteria bacterium]